MREYEKQVQQKFLDDEKIVIRRLKKTYTQSLDSIQDKIKNLEFTIGKLQQKYDWLDDSDPEKTKVKSMIQSKIYQKRYQEQLQSQLDDILKKMHINEYATIAEYLDDCYTNGFVGAMYSINQQGVPIIAPLDQTAMVRAVQLESKISKGLYTRLGEDVNLLKKKITAQVSRGIASGMSYAQVAKGLTNYSKIGYNNAIRIARTEGHRIQCASTMDACYKAKEKGADILRMWDATLDKRTRDSHAQIHGEVRDVDEKFSNGLMFPGDPNGRPEEVINCRCALLQRAKWALDEGELIKLKEDAAYFGLDKSSEFEDFKKKFLNAVDKGFAAKIGGGDIPEHDEPILLKVIDYSNKNEVYQTLTEFEKYAIMDDVETACVITRDGKVYKCFGIKNQVFPNLDLGDEFFGASMSHNHPITETSYTFSDNDFELFQQYNLDVLHGCDEKYTYELTRNASLIDEEPDRWDTEENYFHSIMILKAKENGLGYRRWLNG